MNINEWWTLDNPHMKQVLLLNNHANMLHEVGQLEKADILRQAALVEARKALCWERMLEVTCEAIEKVQRGMA